MQSIKKHIFWWFRRSCKLEFSMFPYRFQVYFVCQEFYAFIFPTKNNSYTWSPAPMSGSSLFACTPSAILGDCCSIATSRFKVRQSKPIYSVFKSLGIQGALKVEKQLKVRLHLYKEKIKILYWIKILLYLFDKNILICDFIGYFFIEKGKYMQNGWNS